MRDIPENSIIGQKVYIPHKPTGIDLTIPYGTIIEREEMGYLIVKLDAPAFYHGNVGKWEKIYSIREHEDNLRPIHRGWSLRKLFYWDRQADLECNLKYIKEWIVGLG